jgi:hypothetical protein
MSKYLIPLLLLTALAAQSPGAEAQREIYKVVNPDGSVTYTDERPSPGAEPVKLKPLSVVKTEKPVAPTTPDAATETESEPTPRDLMRMFRDFAITQPQNEETFWGSGNQVTIGWGSSQSPLEGMSALLFINGEPQEQPAAGSVTVELERGEHRTRAVLRDAANRKVAETDTVVFFVKQHSVNFN